MPIHLPNSDNAWSNISLTHDPEDQVVNKNSTRRRRVPLWLHTLLSHPHLRHTAEGLINRSVGGCEDCSDGGRLVYVHQRELALVTPQSNRIELVGSGDATTCVIVMMVARRTQRTIVAHCDGASKEQITQGRGKKTDRPATTTPASSTNEKTVCVSLHDALDQLTSQDLLDGIDVHLAGGFQTHATQEEKEEDEEDEEEEGADADDADEYECDDDDDDADDHDQSDGLLQVRDILTFLDAYTTPIVESNPIEMRLQTMCVGPLNTQWCPPPATAAAAVPSGSVTVATDTATTLSYPRPYVTALYYSFSSRRVSPSLPLTFDSRTCRGPAMILRCIRGFLGPATLSHAYEEDSDQFVIRPFKYPRLSVSSDMNDVYRAGHKLNSNQRFDTLTTNEKTRETNTPCKAQRYHTLHRLTHDARHSRIHVPNARVAYVRSWRFSSFVCFCLPSFRQPSHLGALLALPDDEFLQRNSTSPTCEPPNFVPDMRATFEHLRTHTNWLQTFTKGEQHNMRYERVTGDIDHESGEKGGRNVWKRID